MSARRQDLIDRQPPCDLSAETGLIGSVFLLPDMLDRVAGLVTPADFYGDANGKIFAALQAMHKAGQPVDNTLLLDHLKTSGELEAVGGAVEVLRIIWSVPNAAHATYYAEIVKEKSRLRRLIVDLTDGLSQCYENLPADDIAGFIERQLATAGQGRSAEVQSAADVVAATIKEIEADVQAPAWPGIMTGLSAFDEVAGPQLPGEVQVIAARPGNGKTALAAGIAIHNAEQGRRGLIVSLEMRSTELMRRHLCGRAGLDSRNVRRGKVSVADIGRIRVAGEYFGGLPLMLWAPPSTTLPEIRSVARHQKATKGLQFLAIDYVGLIRPEAEDRRLQRWEQFSRISAGIKTLARELEVPIIVLVQLGRDGDTEEPRLSHLRDSGAIEQDADSVVFIHHPPPSKSSAAEAGSVYASGVHLIIAKHRHGERGRVRLLWHPRSTSFSSPSPF